MPCFIKIYKFQRSLSTRWGYDASINADGLSRSCLCKLPIGIPYFTSWSLPKKLTEIQPIVILLANLLGHLGWSICLFFVSVHRNEFCFLKDEGLSKQNIFLNVLDIIYDTLVGLLNYNDIIHFVNKMFIF